jgi:hypothetical protein
MFTPADRARVERRLLDLAAADPAVPAAAITGSTATGAADRWSDLDIALAVDGPLQAALDRWTAALEGEFGALHWWDLPSGPSVYRVFLLPGWLEIDLSFTPAAAFGPRGPAWRPVFGRAGQPPADPPPGPRTAAGHAWHHALHARTAIERGRAWQAEYWISALRDQVVTLATRRLGLPDAHARGAHLLPGEVTDPIEPALVRSLDQPELRRALAAAVAALGAELTRGDPALAARLAPMLPELTEGP